MPLAKTTIIAPIILGLIAAISTALEMVKDENFIMNL